MRSDLRSVSGTPFGPGSTRLRFRFNISSRVINAMWCGQLTPLAGSMASIELGASQSWDLLKRLPEGYPAPRYVVFGPLSLRPEVASALAAGAHSVEPGDVVGSVTGDTLELGFFDAANFAIDPAWCLRLFDSLGAWDLPDPGGNPLLDAAPLPSVVSIVGSGSTSGPALTLRPATGRVRFIHPPGSVMTDLFPFIASDAITVGLIGVPAGTRWRAVVQDLLAGTPPFTTAYSAASEVSFEPWRDLVVPGPITQARRLRYRISVQFESPGLTAVPPVEIQQATIDQLRQEYEDAALTVPPRSRVGPVRERWTRIDSRLLFGRNDYVNQLQRHGVDPYKLPLLAEALACAFERILHPPDTNLLTDPRSWLTSDLMTIDGYHNPRRHAALGSGAHNAALYSFYMAVKPYADRHNAIVYGALTDAAVEVLTEVLALNSPRPFRRLEVRLLNASADPLWSWTIDSGGSVTSVRAPSATASLTSATDALQQGGLVELFFEPTDVAAELTIPDPRPKEDALAPGRQSIILIGGEVPTSDERIPIDDSAETLRAWLQEKYTDDPEYGDLPPQLLVVNSPIEFLTALGVIGDRPLNLRLLVTMAHSYDQGLLIYSPIGLDHLGIGWPHEYIHDNAIAEKMRDLYGSRIDFGSDDLGQFATHQFRVSNLEYLPEDMKRRLRSNLRAAEGIFLIGCNTNPASDHRYLTITESFANVANRTTWGASVSAKFKKRRYDGTWVDHDELRGVGTPGAETVILLPEDSEFDVDRQNFSAPDLMEIYRQAYTKAEPRVR